MKGLLTSDQECVEDEFQDARTSVVTDAVAAVVGTKSGSLKSEGGTKQDENVAKDAHEVGGVLCQYQSHVARQLRAVQHDKRTVTTQRKPTLPEPAPTVTGDLTNTV